MKIEMTIIELLSRIKDARRDFNKVYESYINPETSKLSRAMVSLYNAASGYSVNGIRIEYVTDDIKKINNEIKDAYYTLSKLLMIKEQVNAVSKLKVPSLYSDEEVELSIAQILMIKSPEIRKYNQEYLDKLESDYNEAAKALTEYQKTVMSNDKVERYVLAKINSLNMSREQATNEYEKFANEYRNANKMKILDPLSIKDTISDMKKRVNKFYTTIDVILMNYNATTKIWIDLENPSEMWGFV